MNLSARHSDRAALIAHYPDPTKALDAERFLIERFKDPCVNYHIIWWNTTRCLIAPSSMKRVVNIQYAIEQSASAGWPVYFRQTGGDVTPQGAGVLNVALAFAMDPVEQPSFSAVYQMFCTPMIRWLKAHGCDARTGLVPGSFCDGEYNIVIDSRKVAGTAQRWSRVRAGEPRQIVFAHALLLMDANLSACVAAINRLYDCCQIERSVQAAVHTNLADVLSNPRPEWQDELVRSLDTMYVEELNALTS